MRKTEDVLSNRCVESYEDPEGEEVLRGLEEDEEDEKLAAEDVREEEEAFRSGIEAKLIATHGRWNLNRALEEVFERFDIRA